jgi:hypothetical protein
MYIRYILLPWRSPYRLATVEKYSEYQGFPIEENLRRNSPTGDFSDWRSLVAK